MMLNYFPFERLGLLRNPFSTLDQDEWSDFAWLHPELKRSLESGKSIIQILGDPGTGKTSALFALKRELEHCSKKASYVYLRPDRRPPMLSLKENEVLLVDEIERLSSRGRKRLIRTASTRSGIGLRLVFSSHLDLHQEFPEPAADHLSTLRLPSINSTELETMLNNRIGAATNGEMLHVWFTRSAAEELLDRYLGDLRTMERILYEVFQALDEKGALDRGRMKHMLRVIDEPMEPG